MLPHNELLALQKNLPSDSFCLINHDDDKIYYALMYDDMHVKCMDILSGETLEQMEYMEEKEFKAMSTTGAKIIGNRELLARVGGK